MQNTTDVIGLSIQDRLHQLLRQNTQILLYAGVTAAAALLSSSYILRDISPFGVAFVASVKGAALFPAVFGALIGYIWSPVMESNMQYIAAVFILGMLRWFFSSGKIWRRTIQYAPLMAGGAMFTASLMVAFATGAGIYGVAMAMALTMLCGGTAYFFDRTRYILAHRLQNADRSDLICLFVSFAIGVTAMSRLTVFGISLGRILAVLLILVFAYAGGESAGTLVGVGAGATALVLGKNVHFLMGGYALGGLVAGVFSTAGRVGTALAFLITCTAAGITSPTGYMMRCAIYESLIACAVFLVLPQRLFNHLHLQRAGTAEADGISAEHGVLRKRMARAAESLREIGATTRQVSEKLRAMQTAAQGDVYEGLVQTVCKKCPRSYRCWQMEYNSTMDSLNRCMTLLKQSGHLEKEQLPELLKRECRRPQELVNALNTEFVRYIDGLHADHRVEQVRSVVTDQFEGLAMLLEELGSQWDAIRTREPKLEGRVQEYLEQVGLEPSGICCFLDDNDCLTIEAEINHLKLPRLDSVRAALDIGDLVERELDLPAVRTGESGAILTFLEKANYMVEFGSAQIVEEGSTITGDFYQHFNDGRGSSVVILSDGMGSGGNAAVDSAMTAGLLRRLLEAGVGYDAALKMVNSALLVKSGEETLATVDISAVDLYTGRVTLYKAGAAPTFFVKNGKVGYIQSTSLPAGILEGVAFEKSSVTLHEGDRIVVVSDGVTATGVDWLQSQLLGGAGLSPQELAQNVAETAKARHVKGRDDDITVVVAELRRGI